MTQAAQPRIYKLEEWDTPPALDHPVAIRHTWSVSEFLDYYWNVDAQHWWMTEAQRETWANEIIDRWYRFRHIVRADRTDRHLKQLADMHSMGGGLIVIAQEYGMGKSIIANTHLKLWQLMTLHRHGTYLLPYIYWTRKNAKKYITRAPRCSAHSIDEDQEDSASASRAIIKHLRNYFETIRKTDKLGIQAGVNVKTGELGRAIAFTIKPFGFNADTQSNRFIVYNYRDEPLWLAAIQRMYSPDERVYYIDEIGTFSEYNARAEQFSRTSDGVYSARDSIADIELRDNLVEHWNTQYSDIRPTMDALRFEARQIMTPDVEAQVDEIVASAYIIIKNNLADTRGKPEQQDIQITEEGWDALREALRPLAKDNTVEYLVPTIPNESYPDCTERLGLNIRPDSYGKRVRQRRRQLQRQTKKISDISERAVVSWLDSSAAVWGGGGSETSDVLLHDIHLNVKLTLKDSYKDQVEVSPECDHAPRALAVLLVPRALQIRLFPLTGHPKQTLNSTGGGLATPRTLGERIQEMIAA